MIRIPEAPLDAHCRRVAAWATQAAHNADCSAVELASLEKAALSHHYPPLLLRAGSLSRIASDMKIEIGESRQGSTNTELSLSILEAFHRCAPRSDRAGELAEMLDWADQFDEQFELEALDPPQTYVSEAAHLQLVNADAVLRAGQMLPVFPTVAQRAMRLLAIEDVQLEQLEAILRTDQALATGLLKVANAALTGPRKTITTLRQAIGHVGLGTTTRVICAACLRPVFASRNLQELWNHSLEAAQVAERFALVSERVDPGEAFLSGLIHDIGRLAYSLLSCDYQVQSQRLLEYGCQPVLIEKTLTGTSHSEIGAELLQAWGLPPHIVTAVKSHHDPDKAAGPLAALLYLTEFWTLSDEDLPSFIKLEQALRTLDVPMQLLVASRPRATPSLSDFKLPVAS